MQNEHRTHKAEATIIKTEAQMKKIEEKRTAEVKGLEPKRKEEITK
jgi:hypothetical protein